LPTASTTCALRAGEGTLTDLTGSLRLFAELSGWTLARAHARSGEPAEIHGYLGPGTAFDRAVTGFAVGYADQTDSDTRRLREAVDSGAPPSESDTLASLPR
jgi:hypothetical protein